MKLLSLFLSLGVALIGRFAHAQTGVTLNEFMASNTSGIRDGYGLTSDWIELYNGETNEVDLVGWHLTDSLDSPTRWTFPSTRVAPGKFLIVFASGQGTPDPSGALHTNFKLSSSGSYLALIQPNGTSVATEYRPQFPPQRDDVSYGRTPPTATNSLNGAAFFLKPTPGSNNNSLTVIGFAEAPQFNLKRGFLSVPTDIVIQSPTPGAILVVTTNGSIPSLTNGLRFLPTSESTSLTATSRVSTTTVLRAATFKPSFQPSRIDTHTYLFLVDVIRQPAAPPGFPRDWGGTTADYAMDQRVVTNAHYREEILQDMRSIPTLSIVVNPIDLFSNTRGIYSLSENVGDSWERAASLELIEADGSSGFQEDCGLRIWGTGWRPHSSSLKHALQVKFQDQYGAKKLTYPLFKDAPVREFDNLVLRAQGSRSWNDFRTPDIEQTQYIHDAWARDARRDMGTVDGHATFVHLYLNGLYWGLYNPVEKTDEGFAEAYYGGDKSEYDVVSRRFEAEPHAGTLEAWGKMWAIVRKGPVNAERYRQIREYLDVDDLIDYMLLNQYATNHDGPTHNGNNMRAIRRRAPGGLFRFYVWDMEYTMWYAQENNLNVTIAETPAELFQWLRKDSDFRQLYADHAHRHLVGTGALTPGAAGSRWLRRAEEIYGAVVGESARWGDARRPAQPYTRNIEWQTELNRLTREFFPQRSGILLQQLKEAGLYPAVQPAVLSLPAGPVTPGTALPIQAPAGTVFYTTDGTDPRLAGGNVSPNAQSMIPTWLLVSNTSPAKVWVPQNSQLGDAWTQSNPTFDDRAWTPARATLGFDVSPISAATPVDLRNATADYSEASRAIELVLDTNTTATGWGLFQADFVNKARGAVAVFETSSTVDHKEGTVLTFQLKHGKSGSGSLGRFRLSVTSDDRDLFADGLSSGGDVAANWTSLTPLSATSTAGSVFTFNTDRSILVSGKNASTNTYTITALTGQRNITGIRLEAFEDTSLPNRGPGRGSDGNCSLTDFRVHASPAPLNSVLPPAEEALALESLMRGRNSSAYVRIPFHVEATTNPGALRLQIRYEDGFVCYLNGREVARRNAPTPVLWNSDSTTDRERGLAFEPEIIDLTHALPDLLAGENILAFQALNNSPTSTDFLLQAELMAEALAPLVIHDNVTLKARVLLNGEWSALTEATYATRSPIRITEIQYNPPGDGPFNGDEFEFVEVQNTSSNRFNLGGLYFSEGIDFRFQEGSRMEPGEFWVLVRNPVQFARRYPGIAIRGTYTGKLDNGGEALSIASTERGVLFSVVYSDSAPWPAAADGHGFSLVPHHPENLASRAGSEAWRASHRRLGSPGSADPDPAIPEVWITEVLANPSAEGLDAIELHNPNAQGVDVSGWYLTDDRAIPRKFRLPAGTLIPAHGYLVFDESSFNPVPLSPTSFALDAEGDSVYLFSSDLSGNLTGFSDGFAFGVSPAGGSFGRVALSDGTLDFPLQSNSTLGTTNTTPLVSTVAITEIAYRPLDPEEEFIELRNMSSVAVPLFDPAFPTNCWMLNGVGFTFPTGASLPAAGVAVVVKSTPESFRIRFGVPPTVQLFGPFQGTLQDGGERIELLRPLAPSASGTPYVVVDAVRYSDQSPWPIGADGYGPSLHRIDETSLGADPRVWTAAAPNPGEAYSGGNPPHIGEQPMNTTSVRGENSGLRVSAGGTEPLLYQWRFSGHNLPHATNAILLITNIQSFQSGAYSVTVYNSAGVVQSSAAIVNVWQPPVITLQPTGRIIGVGTTVTLTSGALGTGALHYQWQFNEEDLPGANSPTLSLSRAQESQSGSYRLVVRDDLATAFSQSAMLQVIQPPRLITPPQSATAVEGQQVPLFVRVEGTPPLSYRWRSNGVNLTNLILNTKYSVILTGPFRAGDIADFSVTITNRFGPKLDTPNARIVVLADRDRDGMPDAWETGWGLNPEDARDAAIDGDQDGMSNVEEFVAGTDPTDSQSFLSARLEWQNSAMGVGFLAVSNRAYSVQYREELDTKPWANVGDIQSQATQRSVFLPVPNPGKHSYYRIVTPPQP